MCVCVPSRIKLFVTLWTVARQTPLFMAFPRQGYWSGLPFPSPGDLPNPGIEPTSSALMGGFFTIWATREAPAVSYVCVCVYIYMCVCVCIYIYFYDVSKNHWVLIAQSCQTLCDPMNCNSAVSSVPEILQARILQWVALPFSRGSSRPRGWTWVSCMADRFFTVFTPPGKPQNH